METVERMEKFCFPVFVLVSYIMIKTHNDDVQCEDCARADTGFISTLNTVCVGGEDVSEEAEKAEYVWQPPRCLQCALCVCQHSRVHCSHLHTKSA